MPDKPYRHITRQPHRRALATEQELEGATLYDQYHHHAHRVMDIEDYARRVKDMTLASVHLSLPAAMQPEPAVNERQANLVSWLSSALENVTAREQRTKNTQRRQIECEFDFVESLKSANKQTLVDAWKAKEMISILGLLGNLQNDAQRISEMARQYQEKYGASGEETIWSGNAPPYQFGQKLSYIAKSSERAQQLAARITTDFGLPLIAKPEGARITADDDSLALEARQS
jgi:hypothetical protein